MINFIDKTHNQGKLPVMLGNLMKLKIKPDSSSPSKEMEFGREEVTQNRLKQLNKVSWTCFPDTAITLPFLNFFIVRV